MWVWGRGVKRVMKTSCVDNVLYQCTCRKGLGRGTGGNVAFTCTTSLDGGGGEG